MKGRPQIVKAKLWNRLAKGVEREFAKEWPSNGKWEFTEGIYGPSILHISDEPKPAQ
jgi:hypothetical protein